METVTDGVELDLGLDLLLAGEDEILIEMDDGDERFGIY